MWARPKPGQKTILCLENFFLLLFFFFCVCVFFSFEFCPLRVIGLVTLTCSAGGGKQEKTVRIVKEKQQKQRTLLWVGGQAFASSFLARLTWTNPTRLDLLYLPFSTPSPLAFLNLSQMVMDALLKYTHTCGDFWPDRSNVNNLAYMPGWMSSGMVTSITQIRWLFLRRTQTPNAFLTQRSIQNRINATIIRVEKVRYRLYTYRYTIVVPIKMWSDSRTLPCYYWKSNSTFPRVSSH